MERAVPLALAVAVLLPGLGLSQEPRETRLINLPTTEVLSVGRMEVLFTHRFTETVSDGGGYDLFGLDSAADIGIGLALGLGRGIQAELYRSSFFKQIEAAAKVAVVEQGAAWPITVALRVGAEYRGAHGITDRWSGFGQAVVSRRLGERLEVTVVPMFASDTPTVRNAVNVGFGASLTLPRRWGLAGEVVPRNRDAVRGGTAWALGVAKRVPGHEFLIYAGNSRATTADLLTGSDLPGGFRSGDVRLGFNLVRRFP